MFHRESCKKVAGGETRITMPVDGLVRTMYWCACRQCRQDVRGGVIFFSLRRTAWPDGYVMRRTSPIAWRVYSSGGTFQGMEYVWGRRFDGSDAPRPNVHYRMISAVTMRALEYLNFVLQLARPFRRACLLLPEFAPSHLRWRRAA